MSSETPEDPFVRLLLSMPALASYPHETFHEVRLRRNVPKNPTPTDSRTLFLKNIPSDADESRLRAVFASLVGPGRFESASFPDGRGAAVETDPAAALKMAAITRKRKRDDGAGAGALPPVWGQRVHKSGSTALVTLADEKSLQLVLKAISKTLKTKKYPSWPATTLGPDWLATHLRLSRADKAVTQGAIHAFFTAFNEKEAAAAALAKRLRSEPDADGFVTVTRGARAAPASKASAEEAARKMAEKEARKKEEMRGFYRFQLREARREEQGRLRKRFEEDRRRVEGMKEKRGKFRPET